MATRTDPTGSAAVAAWLAAVLSGLALAAAYDTSDAFASVARMLLAEPAARLARNLHFWSALAFVLAALAAAWARARRPGVGGTRPRERWRVVLGVLALALLAGSGFLLRGDDGSRRILGAVGDTMGGVPVAGPVLARALVGNGEGTGILLLHHALTFTVLAGWWMIGGPGRWAIAGRGRRPSVDGAPRRRPRWVPAAAVLGPVAVVSLWISPGLDHERAGGGPPPSSIESAGRAASEAWNARFVHGWVFAAPDPAAGPLDRPLPVALGRPEGCLVCHSGVTGLSAAHDPAAVGCASCHLGNPFSLRAATAHQGMLLVPGNLAQARRTCGGDCHDSVVTRVERSLMTTLAGIVTVNRRAWNEASPESPPHVARIGHSAADSHVRHLCALCHLGAVKTEPGPVGELPQGGGCAACHVRYGAQAKAQLERYLAQKEEGESAAAPRVHPDVALPVDDAPCFGCHSRSGRISLSYDGWHEARPPPAERRDGTTRTLEDERVLVQVAPDAHSARGMLCIDCHTATEVMGDGTLHARQSDALRVGCGDCHPHSRPLTVAASEVDAGSRRILRLRNLPVSQPLVATASGDVLVNAHVEADGRIRLARKRDGARLDPKPAPPPCRDAVHARVACTSCHTAWAPRCPECHTRYDRDAEGYDLLEDRPARGDWLESAGDFKAAPPTLGVRRLDATGAGRTVIEPVVPGMIATFDGRKMAGGPEDPIFRRWYARAFSHTVSKAGRSCASCHNDPVALGYGEGRLELVAAGDGRGRWRFTPAHAAGPDGLPGDSWTGFLRTRESDVSTRDDVHPLPVETQRRMLTAGACLTCHEGGSAVMQRLLRGEERAPWRVSARCRVPVWEGEPAR